TAAARNVVPCILELGGKSAAVVYPDTDMDLLVDSVRWGIFYNAGQVCSAMSRLIVHEDIHDEVLERLISMTSGLSTGPGIDLDEMGPNMGAMISEKQRDNAVAMCAQAEAEGGRISIGGKAIDRPGWFFEPTIISEVQQSQTIAQEEVFGPVLSVLKFKQDEEAVKMANATQYGLVSGVFTRDLDRAMTTARKLRAGQVYVNEWYAGGVETPFGGYGKSGYGRERGREALNNYVHTKNIAVALKS
ncbi:MAG: aldehyde dehydrogenase (NAD+), partial [Lysobacterales bacterium]